MDLKQELVKYLLVPAILAVLSAASWALTALARKFDAEKDTSKVSLVLSKLDNVALAIVQDIEANEKTALEEASADGAISADEAARLKAIAIERLKAVLGTKGRDELISVLGLIGDALAHLLSGVVERAVAQASLEKAQRAAMVARAAVATPTQAVAALNTTG